MRGPERRTATHRASSQPMAIPLMSQVDAAVGNAIEAAVCGSSTGAGCGGSAGSARSSRPTTGCGRPAIRRRGRLRARRPRRRRAGAARDRRGDAGRALARAPHRLAPRAALRARPRRAATIIGATAGRAGRARRRARAGVGGRAGAGLPPDALGGRARPSTTLDAQHAHPLRARPARAPVPLPSREDRRHRRRAGLRRRHRPHRRRPATASTPPSTRPPARLGWHDVGTRLRGPGGRRRRRALRHALARGDRRAHRAPVARPRRAGDEHGPGRPHGGRGHVRRRARAATSASSRATCGRCARAQLLSTSRTSSCGRRRSSRPGATSSATRRATTSGSSSLLPAKANNGQDDTRGQLGVLAEADDGGKRFLAATIRARTGERDDPLYVHAKVGIVDDRWLTVGSANLNAHSLLNDTEMNVVDRRRRAGARDARCGCGPSTSSSPPEDVADADPRRSSTSAGSRSPPSSSRAARRARRRPIA